MRTEIPSNLEHLLTDPNYGVLAVERPDGYLQANPMWFEYVDGTIKFTHTTTRLKFRALQRNPHMTLTVLNPENPFEYLELRGKLVDVTADPTGAYYDALAKRYSNYDGTTVPDAADRVILTMSIEQVGIK